MLSIFIDAALRLMKLINGLLSQARDSRLIALGEHRSTERALKLQKDTILRVKKIDADVAAMKRRHDDDTAFDESFKRKDPT